MGEKLKFALRFAAGAAAGCAVGYFIDRSSDLLQPVLAIIVGFYFAKIYQSMDRDPAFTPSSRTMGDAIRYFTGAGLGKRGALKLIFASLAVVSTLWLAQSEAENYAMEWFGYDTSEFVEDRWPIVMGVLTALLGGYRYLASSIEPAAKTAQ